jgi:hypothetical protein
MEILSSLLYRFRAQQLGFKVCILGYKPRTNRAWRAEVTHMWNADPETLKAKLDEWMASLGTYSFQSGRLNLFTRLTSPQCRGLGNIQGSYGH